jgi:hypothetical protein
MTRGNHPEMTLPIALVLASSRIATTVCAILSATVGTVAS